LVTNSTEYFSYSRRVDNQNSATQNPEKSLKIENLTIYKQSVSTSVPNSAAVIPNYEKLQIADRMGDINENFDDNDSCNISNVSSSSRPEN